MVTRSKSRTSGNKAIVARKQTVGIKAQTAASSVRIPYVKKTKSNKQVGFTRVKDVKVSSLLRKKVNKIMESREIHGKYQQIEFGYLNFSSTWNTQSVGHTIVGSYDLWAFTPENMLHQMSVLWNNKADSQSTRPWNVTSNLGGDGVLNANVSAKAFSAANNCTGHVKFANECYNLKNNSLVSHTIVILLCAPKQVMSRDSTPGAIDGTSSGVDTTTTTTPLIAWQNAAIDAAKDGLNVNNIGIAHMHSRPYHYANWNKYYSYEETQIVLEPGQSFCFNIKGPQNMEFDMKKYFRNGFFQGIQKFCRFPLFITKGELMQDSGSGGIIGYAGGKPDAIGGGEVIIERVGNASYTMPEKVGAAVTTSSVAGQVQLNNRKPGFAYYNYGIQTVIGNIVKVDELTPIALINPGGISV